ncbi:MAG: TerD family protein [Pyrinomonadaceae bacterium]|nr:TerD family protein [Pyrinomonadaceae bacterium]
MAINLQKGQTINLEKSQYDLSEVTIGLGWDVRKAPGGGGGGFFGKMFGAKDAEVEYDLDATAFLLDANDKIINVGDQKLIGGDVIFFNNLRHSSGNIWLTGDNRTGAGDGDDEQIKVQLNALSPQFNKILFIVSIYQGQQKNQHFGSIENAFIRAVDRNGKEMARFSLSGDASFTNKRSLVFAEVYRRDGGWKFRALGNPYDTDSFVEILKGYMR